MCLHTVTQPVQHQTNPVTGFYSIEKLNDHTHIFHSGLPADVLNRKPCTLFLLPAVSSFWRRFNCMPRTITFFVPSVHFSLNFEVASMISSIHPRLIHTKLLKPTFPSLFSTHCPSLYIRKYLFSLSASQTLSPAWLSWFFWPKCSSSLVLSIRYDLVHIF